MTNIIKNHQKKTDNQLFTSTLTFCNLPVTFDSCIIQPEYQSIETFQTQNSFNNGSKSGSQMCSGMNKDIADTKSTEKDNVSPRKYFSNREIAPESTIQVILKEQNSNLKQQNSLLLAQIQRLMTYNKKYKDLYKKQKVELLVIQKEGLAHKARADEMKGVIMNKLMALQGKMMAGKEAVSSEQDSIMEPLCHEDNCH